ncbi:MAG: hypothetical protein LUE63_08895 [Lachnospiraceae bacterium]|nr:hypothetical protein [Lachnospiraceae bacterium]
MAKEKKVYQRKNIVARIYSIQDGLTEVQKVDFIRIKSERYNLMIMEDYMPTLGELRGDLTVEAEGKTFRWENVNGFYIHQNNLFRFMLREERTEEAI